MNFEQIIQVNDNITLELFNLGHKNTFFEAIHELTEEDSFRCDLQSRFSNLGKVHNMLDDAINRKLKNGGSPDYFIFYKGSLAGMFEFHPLTEEDHVEMGYWLFAKYRRKKILSTIIPRMITFTKENFNKSKILATTSTDNIASQRLLENMNFTATGRILEFTNSRTGEISEEYEYFYYL